MDSPLKYATYTHGASSQGDSSELMLGLSLPDGSEECLFKLWYMNK